MRRNEGVEYVSEGKARIKKPKEADKRGTPKDLGKFKKTRRAEESQKRSEETSEDNSALFLGGISCYFWRVVGIILKEARNCGKERSEETSRKLRGKAKSERFQKKMIENPEISRKKWNSERCSGNTRKVRAGFDQTLEHFRVDRSALTSVRGTSSRVGLALSPKQESIGKIKEPAGIHREDSIQKVERGENVKMGRARGQKSRELRSTANRYC